MTTSVLSLARTNVWINTVITHLDSAEQRGGKRLKVYSDTFGRLLEIATSQLIGYIREFVKAWEPDELTIPEGHASSEDAKNAVLSMTREATTVVN